MEAQYGAGNGRLVNRGGLLAEYHRADHMYNLRDNQHKPQGRKFIRPHQTSRAEYKTAGV